MNSRRGIVNPHYAGREEKRVSRGVKLKTLLKFLESERKQYGPPRFQCRGCERLFFTKSRVMECEVTHTPEYQATVVSKILEQLVVAP